MHIYANIRTVDMSEKGLHKFQLNAIKEIHYGMKTKEDSIAKIEAVLVLKNHSKYRRFRIGMDKKDYKYISRSF